MTPKQFVNTKFSIDVLLPSVHTHVPTVQVYKCITQDEEDEVEEPSRETSRKALDIDEDDIDDDDEEAEPIPEGGFACHAVEAQGLPKGAGIPTEVCGCTRSISHVIKLGLVLGVFSVTR